jgi:hypothetical protein
MESGYDILSEAINVFFFFFFAHMNEISAG